MPNSFFERSPRRYRALLAVMPMALLMAATGAPPALAETWAGFGPDSRQNPLVQSEPGSEIGRLWRGEPSSSNDSSCTSVVDGRLYVVSAPADEPTQYRLSAMNAATGARLWSTDSFTSNPTLACAAVDGERVYVTTRDRVMAFDLTNGERLWSHAEPDFWASSPPAAAGGAVYLSGAGGHGADYGEHLALDAQTGARRWIVDGSQTERPPLIAGDAVLQTKRSAPGLTAYSAATGQTLWSDTSAFAYGPPAIDDGTVFYATQGQTSPLAIVARDATSGAVRWQWSVPEGQYVNSMVADGTRLFMRMSFYDGGLRGRVIALNRAFGTLAWNKASANGNDTRLMRLGRSVLSLGYSGGAAYDPATGTSTPLKDGFSRVGNASNPAYADSTFYFWSVDYEAGENALEAWRDIAAPSLKLSSPTDGVVTSDPRPMFTWSVDDGAGVGVADVTLRLDGRAPVTLGSSSGSYRADTLADGKYRFSVRANDGVGNAAMLEQDLTVDTEAPGMPVARVPSSTVASARPTFEWSPVQDTTSGVASYELTIDGRSAGTLASSACSADLCRLQPAGGISDGPHTWTVTAIDRAGNRRSGEDVGITVAAPPAGALSANAAVIYAESEIRLKADFSDQNDTNLTYRWDLDGDGRFEHDSGQVPTAATGYSDVATHMVRVQASDPGGLSSSATTTVETRRRPPAGELGVSINDGAIATNNPNVQLTVVWPSFATDALIANDGGFRAAGSAGVFPVAQTLPWKLASSGPERLPKTVYLRFKGGSSGRETYTDDIILDERAPQLLSASTSTHSPGRATAAGMTQRTFAVRAKDDNSGISSIQVSARRGGRGAVTKQIVRRTKRGKRSYKAAVRMRAPSGRVFVRVRDAAGNASAWRRTG